MTDIRFSSLNMISSHLPTGVYTTFRTYNHDQVLWLESHFHRLEESAKIINRPIHLEYPKIRQALREIIALSPEQELRIRLTINPDISPAVVYISQERLITPAPEEYRKGVCTVLNKTIRINPKAKLTSFLKSAELIRNKVSENINEVLMVNDGGQILEGLTSNFFAVIHNEIWTEGEQVLPGIVRSTILEIAEENGIRVQFSAIHSSDINRIEESFLTSTSRSVLPIQRIDATVINTGEPGPITKKLIRLYRQTIKRSLEKI